MNYFRKYIKKIINPLENVIEVEKCIFVAYNVCYQVLRWVKESKMHIYICDDERQILKQIGQKVHELLPECQVTEIGNSTELLELLQKQNCDVLLLDIDMPEITGLEVAEQLKELPEKPLLIFVTGHDELVYDSLQFHPFGFVRKSFLDKELPKVLQDCERELCSKRQHYHFRTAEGEVSLPLEEILYFEAEGNYLWVYIKGNDEVAGDVGMWDASGKMQKRYRFRETMSTVQEALEKQGFVRVHRGFLVNQAAVELLGADELKLVNGSSIPIGRNYGEAAKKQIMRYMLR